MAGFAIYGINQLGEKFRGHHLSSAAKDSLNELCDYCDVFLRATSVLKHKDRQKIKRYLKPLITETALNKALDDINANGDSSMTAARLKTNLKLF
jgi:hypothetical protein